MSDLPVLTLEQFLAVEDRREETVPIPEWGGCVRVRSLTKGEQRELREIAKEDYAQYELLMFVTCCVEPRLTVEHVETLRQRSAGAVDLVLQRILALSGITRDGRIAQEAVKTAEAQFRV